MIKINFIHEVSFQIASRSSGDCLINCVEPKKMVVTIKEECVSNTFVCVLSRNAERNDSSTSFGWLFPVLWLPTHLQTEPILYYNREKEKRGPKSISLKITSHRRPWTSPLTGILSDENIFFCLVLLRVHVCVTFLNFYDYTKISSAFDGSGCAFW